jgi:hypothetical protein
MGHLEAVRAEVGAEGKQALEQPLSNRWWDGVVNEQLMVALQKVRGDSVVEKVSYDTLKGALGPIVMPLVKVTLALTGSSPNALLSRSGQFLSTSVRGREVTWTLSGTAVGTYAVRYPVRVPRAYLPLWKGMMSYVFELTGVKGSVTDATADLDGQTFRYTLRWA